MHKMHEEGVLLTKWRCKFPIDRMLCPLCLLQFLRLPPVELRYTDCPRFFFLGWGLRTRRLSVVWLPGAGVRIKNRLPAASPTDDRFGVARWLSSCGCRVILAIRSPYSRLVWITRLDTMLRPWVSARDTFFWIVTSPARKQTYYPVCARWNWLGPFL